MANIMNVANVRNKTSYEGFDLSRKFNFSSKAGEILPVMMVPVLPFDKIKVDLSSFTRTQPVNTPAFARMREYYDFFFVPLDQLWIYAPTVLTQMKDNVQRAQAITGNQVLSGDMPYFTCEDIANYLQGLESYKSVSGVNYSQNPFGYKRGELTVKLLHYLGYGDYSMYAFNEESSTGGSSWSEEPLHENLRLNVFPLLAYQKIYSDFYRYTQWEASAPETFNVDYITGSDDLRVPLPSRYQSGVAPDFVKSFNMFDLRYCNYQKDMFHGILPVAQFGDASVASLSGTLTGSVDKVIPTFLQDTGDNVTTGTPEFQFVGTSTPRKIELINNSSGSRTIYIDPSTWSVTLQGANANIPILALRRAEAAQKWKEVSLAAEEDYKSQIEAHWGQSVSDYLSGMCKYLGSVSDSLDINEVTNTNITGDNAAELAGKGLGSGRGNIYFENKGQYGILMCCKHVLPILDYVTSGVDPYCLCTNATSYPIPEFDQIGMDSVPLAWATNPLDSDFVSNYPNFNATFLGYAPRYISWKTAYDRSVGVFAKKMKSWCVAYDDDSLLKAASILFNNTSDVPVDSVDAGFFKCDPAVLNPIFALAVNSSIDTDQFLSSCYFDIKVSRLLDKNGLPY